LGSLAENRPMWVSIPGMDKGDIRAIFTTRHGGVSSFPFGTLNLSFQRGDSREIVIENFRRLSERTGISMEKMVLSRQVHGSEIKIVNKRHSGMGLATEHTLGETDGLITAERGVALVTFYADCTPIYLYDRVKNIIGLIHSGWRGTLLNISAKAVETMKREFNCKGENIIAALGPHIRKCCFEVGNEVYQDFLRVFPDCNSLMRPLNRKWVIDLSGIIISSLVKAGLDENQIQDIGRCTVCEKELFFSHRGGPGNTGTGAALLMMVE